MRTKWITNYKEECLFLVHLSEDNGSQKHIRVKADVLDVKLNGTYLTPGTKTRLPTHKKEVDM